MHVRSIIFGAVATFALASTAHAAPAFKTVPVAVPSAELLASINAVCITPAIKKSARALEACQNEQFPRLRGDGTQFVNTGLGGEFNVLIRQLSAVAAE